MIIKTTTTIVLVNDQGKELLRCTGKGFSTLSDPAKWANGLTRAVDQAKSRSKVAMAAFLDQLAGINAESER